MVGASRQKIDPQTRQLFDAEVDKPEHDKVLTTLFADDERLIKLLMRLHGLKELKQPTESSKVEIWSSYRDHTGYAKPHSVVDWNEAVKLGGFAPTWKTLCPIRDLHKSLEVPLYMDSGPRSTRLMGFIDMVLRYWIPSPMHLVQGSNGKLTWGDVKDQWHTMVEIKGVWPTAGNLLRQLNLYRACNAASHGSQKLLVIGPDDSMNEVVGAHHWRLAHFNSDLSSFWMAPSATKTKKKDVSLPHEF